MALASPVAPLRAPLRAPQWLKVKGSLAICCRLEDGAVLLFFWHDARQILVGQGCLGWDTAQFPQPLHPLGACFSPLDDEDLLQFLDCQFVYCPPIRHILLNMVAFL
jgi:hypothetical protein